MTLSLEKLQYFLDVNHYTPQKYFMYKGRCRFIEVLSYKYGTTFLLVVSSFHFQIPSSENVFDMTKLPTIHVTDDVSDYVHVSEHQIEKTYNAVEPDTHLPHQTTRVMSEHLTDYYKHEVIVDDMKQSESVIMKNIHRQLNRLKYCVHGLNHSVAILHSTFLGTLSQDKVVLYKIMDSTPKKMPVLYVVADFATFYDKIKTVGNEIQQLYTGIYKVLNHNQSKHTRNMQRIIENRENVLDSAGYVGDTKKRYSEYIDKYTHLLHQLYDHEQRLHEELDQFKVRQEDDLRVDMKRVHHKQAIEKKLTKSKTTKRDLLNTLKELHEKNQHLTLVTDNILFNNIVMLDKIFKNFETLDKLKATD